MEMVREKNPPQHPQNPLRTRPSMNPLALVSTTLCGICVVLSAIFFIKSSSVQGQQADLQKRQQELQTQQQAVQLQQQQMQTQQQQINAGSQLAQQVGPAVMNDLGLLARDNKNEKLRKLLEKYGLKIEEQTPATQATPAPKQP